MLSKRIIPCLDVREGKTTKGIKFLNNVDIGDPVAMAREYYKAGADEIVRYTEGDFASAARDWTGGRGVDVVYDSVGRTTFEGSMESLRPRGLLCLYGQSSGVVPPFDLNRLNAMGSGSQLPLCLSLAILITALGLNFRNTAQVGIFPNVCIIILVKSFHKTIALWMTDG